MKNTYFFILVIAILVSCAKKQRWEQKPNILLIVADDMGYGDYTPFGLAGSEVSVPNITRLAKSGVVYTQAYVTAPVCSPSRTGLNTGKFQFRWDKKASWGPGLPDSVKTIAEYLKAAGYYTMRIGKNDYGQHYFRNDVREYPLNHGYDQFLGFNAHAHDYWLSSTEIRNRTPDPNGTSAHLGPLMYNHGEKSFENGYLTEIFTDAAINFLKEKSHQPFFLTLAYNSVHHVIHEVPKRYLDKYHVKPIHNYDPDNMETFGNQKPGSYSAYYEKYTRLGAIGDEDMRKYYLANLNCLDDNIGRVLDAVHKDGLDDNTIVIFVSDNGGSPLTGAVNAPLTAGKYSVWEGGIRVPMSIRWPGKTEAGKVVDQYVSTADLLPTLAEAAGANLKDSTLDGLSLFDQQNQGMGDRLLVWKWGQTWAVRKGDWKLTNADDQWGKGRPSKYYIKPISNDLSLKLFNLADDPGERVNLATKHPDKVKELQSDYVAWCNDNLGKY